MDLESSRGSATIHGRVRVLVDSTLATPCNTRPLELGVDLVVPAPPSTCLGTMTCSAASSRVRATWSALLRDSRGVFGSVLDPHAASLIIRGMKSVALRIERQNATALAVAKALEGHPRVKRVFYPMLESHPSYAVAREQLRGGGGMVSFIVDGGREQASRVVDRVNIAHIAASFGGLETLIEQPAIMSFFELTDEQLKAIEIDPALVRLSVGIEDTDDVVRDVVDALSD